MVFEDIKQMAKENENFRQVIFSGKHSQLVLMSLLPKEEIGEETHQTSDQILVIVKGEGQAIVDGEMSDIAKHSVVFVPAGAKHNIINTNEEDALKLYTIYAPSIHADGIIHATKADAAKEKEMM